MKGDIERRVEGRKGGVREGEGRGEGAWRGVSSPVEGRQVQGSHHDDAPLCDLSTWTCTY